MQQTVGSQTTTYVMDLNAGLTQVLSDGTNAYTYGLKRISQVGIADTEYFLGDALGSVRQLTDETGAVTLTKEYGPFGELKSSEGSTTTPYGFSNEYTDSYIKLINLRSRIYSPVTGRFLTRDSWQGDYNRPQSLNGWNYVEANPVNYFDPSGYIKENDAENAWYILMALKRYQVDLVVDWGYVNANTGGIISFLPIDPALLQEYGYSCWKWEEGRWSLNELKIVLGSAINMDIMMGLRRQEFVGPVIITKIPQTCGKGCTYGNRIELLDRGLLPTTPPNDGNLSGYERSDQSINFDQWAVVHEMGHAWDHRNHGLLSFWLMWVTKGGYFPGSECNAIKDPEYRLPGCNRLMYYYGDIPPAGSDNNFNHTEDFAESVAAYVFPIEAQQKIQQYGNPENIYHRLLFYTDYTNTKRWAYINSLVHGRAEISPLVVQTP